MSSASIAVLVLLWAIVVWRLPAAWASSWKRAPWAAFACLAIALTLDLRAVTASIEQLTGITDISVLIKHLAVLASCTAVLDWVTSLSNPAATRGYLGRRHAAAAAVAVTLIVLFCFMPRQGISATQFTETATGPVAVAYLWVFYTWLAVSMVMAVALFQVARLSTPPAQRGPAVGAGLLLLSIGCAVAAVYAACQMAALALRPPQPLGAATTSHWQEVSTGLENLAILLVLAGTVLPAAAGGWQSARELTALRALRPMWRDLTAATPGVAMGPVAASSPLGRTVRHGHLRLIRRATEIRDSALQLTSYVPGPVIATARAQLADRGLHGPQLGTATEACWLRLAASAAAAGGPPPDGQRHTLPGGASLAEETARLRQIAAAYASPAVRAVAAQLTRPGTAPPDATWPQVTPQAAA